MASLNRIKLDAGRINEGKWITVESDGEPFDIRTRGITPRYRDTLQRLRLERVRTINRTRDPGAPMVSVETLPPSLDDLCLGQALAEECFLDVRGLTHDDGGKVVTVDEFKALLCDPETGRIFIALVQAAANEVMADRSGLIETATGNSQPVSAGS